MRKFFICLGIGALDLLKGALCAIALLCNFLLIYCGIAHGKPWNIVVGCALAVVNVAIIYQNGRLLVKENTRSPITLDGILYDKNGVAWRVFCVRFFAREGGVLIDCMREGKFFDKMSFPLEDLGKTYFASLEEYEEWSASE